MINYNKICVFDFETDGSDPRICSPVQIAAVIIDPIKLEIIANSEFNINFKPEVLEQADDYEYTTDILDFHAKVAARGSLMFFLLATLNKVHTFYHFSLSSFNTIVERAITSRRGKLVWNEEAVMSGIAPAKLKRSLLDEAAELLLKFGARRLYAEIGDLLCATAADSDGHPELRYLVAFDSSQYARCLERLELLKPELLLDVHLRAHVEPLYSAVRSKALVSYFSPYRSVDLNRMAVAFATDLPASLLPYLKRISKSRIVPDVVARNLEGADEGQGEKMRSQLELDL